MTNANSAAGSSISLASKWFWDLDTICFSPTRGNIIADSSSEFRARLFAEKAELEDMKNVPGNFRNRTGTM